MQIVNRFIQFVDDSPTAWHTTHNVKKRLLEEGFIALDEQSRWKMQTGRSYFVERSGSIIAFKLPKKPIERAISFGAHTDSPGLKLKPSGQFLQKGVELLNFEVYGSPILPTWIGRELYLAGRIFYDDGKGKVGSELISLQEYPIFIPNLAIHLDREVNEKGLLVQKQEGLTAMATSKETTLDKLLGRKKIIHKELFAVPLERTVHTGFAREWITGPRLDNLASVASCLEAFLGAKTADSHTLSMVAFFNHEEIGSETQEGAASPFFSDTFSRILTLSGKSKEEEMICKARSCTISCDVAHATHPNFQDRHDPRHPVELGKGICIKTNAQERYVSPAELLSALISRFTKDKIAYQIFAARNDIPSGKTIGPIHAAKTGFKTIDLGIPLLGMHAAREMIAVDDYVTMVDALEAISKDFPSTA